MEIILLAGQAGVGKTTAAKVIACEAFNRGFIPILESFAKPIKEEAAAKGYTKEEFPEEYRKYCQNRGAVARQESPDHWVSLMKERISKYLIEEKEALNKNSKYWEKVIIIDDCRYLNEVNFGLLLKASLVFLYYGDRDVDSDNWRQHESEQLANNIEDGDKDLLSLFNNFIVNDSTQEDFEDRLKSMVTRLLNFISEEEEECSCPSRTFNNKIVLEELIDLLDFDYVDELLEEEEEEDDDDG